MACKAAPQPLTRVILYAGEDLLQASADKPFRFPATFTFVVRSFSVLDGIGKSLSPRFDITEIAAPYARNLILEARPQVEKLQQEFQKRLQKQVRCCAWLEHACPSLITVSVGLLNTRPTHLVKQKKCCPSIFTGANDWSAHDDQHLAV